MFALAVREELGWYTPYVHAYYYGMTTLTTVGFGDITPTTDTEKAWTIISELLGTIVFASLAGVLSQMLAESNASSQHAEEQVINRPYSCTRHGDSLLQCSVLFVTV